MQSQRSPLRCIFLSTPSARRATARHGAGQNGPDHFYPRPPRGGRPELPTVSLRSLSFLSTPSARRATLTQRLGELASQFLSTPSARRATQSSSSTSKICSYFYPRPPRGGRRADPQFGIELDVISIHALREEGDKADLQTDKAGGHFYPRPPRGGRHVVGQGRDLDDGFLSTPSARRATRTIPVFSPGV